MTEAFVIDLAAALVATAFHRPGPAPTQRIGHEHPLERCLSAVAALYVREGLPVACDGVHLLAAQCLKPLTPSAWGLQAFGLGQFAHHGLQLLDPYTRLPTVECLDLVRSFRSGADYQEHESFAALRSLCEQLDPSRADEVYTLVRGYVVRHPVTSQGHLQQYLQDHYLHSAAGYLANCYAPPEPHHAVQGALYTCRHCGSAMGETERSPHVAAPLLVRCPTPTCIAFDAPVPLEAAHRCTAADALVAKPHLLQYWCGPGIDELALFDAALQRSTVLQPQLYPGQDLCDVGLQGRRVGIDAKAHSNPHGLAMSLNRNLGGLHCFEHRWLVINERTRKRYPHYMAILLRECRHPGLEILTMRQALKRLREWT